MTRHYRYNIAFKERKKKHCALHELYTVLNLALSQISTKTSKENQCVSLISPI